MRKLIVLIGLITALVAGVGATIAAPGPNGSNNHGLCTAYFNGSETGRTNKHQAGPFFALETAAGARDDEDNDDDGAIDEADEVARAVWSWCSDSANNPKGIDGQPEDPTNDQTEGNGKKGKGRG